jgi:4-hydroxyphenylpyruvate dioxygenase
MFLEGVERKPAGLGFELIDHLTHNVYRGRMDYWANYYENLFNFREIRFFDIKGEYTGLRSRALTAPDGKIRIPLNEEGRAGGKGRSRSTCSSTTAKEYNTSLFPAMTCPPAGTD